MWPRGLCTKVLNGGRWTSYYLSVICLEANDLESSFRKFAMLQSHLHPTHIFFLVLKPGPFVLRCAWTSITPEKALVSVAYLRSSHVCHHMLGHYATPIKIVLVLNMLQILSCSRHFKKCLQQCTILSVPLSGNKVTYITFMCTVSFDLYYLKYYLIKCL